jgi:hypothetical protein
VAGDRNDRNERARIDHAPDGDLRVEVIPPESCSLFTMVYVYRHA